MQSLKKDDSFGEYLNNFLKFVILNAVQYKKASSISLANFPLCNIKQYWYRWENLLNGIRDTKF